MMSIYCPNVVLHPRCILRSDATSLWGTKFISLSNMNNLVLDFLTHSNLASDICRENYQNRLTRVDALEKKTIICILPLHVIILADFFRTFKVKTVLDQHLAHLLGYYPLLYFMRSSQFVIVINHVFSALVGTSRESVA